MSGIGEAKLQIETLDRLQREDHDTLVRVHELTKSISDDVRELKDGTSQRLSAIETDIDLLKKRADSWDLTLRWIKWTIGAVVAMISFIVANLSGLLEVFHR